MAESRPNLLFVFADQLRARELDHPHHPLLTPAYDRLCEEGTRCLDAVANCPVCTPSRAMLLTGQYPLTNRVMVNDLPLPESAVTIGDVVERAGYRTGYIGKWHLDGVPRTKFTPPGPRRHGFQYWAVHNCLHRYLQSSYYRDTDELLPIGGYEPEFQTDLAREFLRAEDPRPFCLFLSWGPPHNPYEQLPPWFARLYDPSRIQPPPNFHDGDGRRRELAHYYGHVSALDQQLMRLLDALDEAGLADDTIVVYTSDHGDMLWSQGRVRKQQPYEESCRIPLVVRWPGAIPAGRAARGCLGIVDLAPSLLSLLGLEVPEAMQGSDLAAFLTGGGETPASSFLMDLLPVDEGFAQGLREWRGVRTARHTYARWVEGGEWLLHDHAADPYQLHNLIESPEHAPVRAELAAELEAWLRRVGDPCRPGFELLRGSGLARLWNARERELRGERARLLEED